METPTSIQASQTHSPMRLVLFILIVAIFMLITAGGVYYWQHSQVASLNTKVSGLQAQVASLKAQQSLTGTFTYSPKVGGLTLTLPKTYGIIVNADGNKGGAIGATFRIATVDDNHMFTDSSYQELRVDIDNIFADSTLTQMVNETELQLKDQGYSTFSVADTTVAGLPAKLITVTDQVPFRPELYIVGSGDLLYTITAAPAIAATPNGALALLLKGLKIKPVTLP